MKRKLKLLTGAIILAILVIAYGLATQPKSFVFGATTSATRTGNTSK